MEWIDKLIGHGQDLDTLQMCCRAFLLFFVTLILIRIAGVRTFGKKTAFDNVITIMLGSVLSRVVVGASPFIPTIAGCLVLVIIHWLLARLSVRNNWIGWLVKGEKSSLYAEGKENTTNMLNANLSSKDLLEGIRLGINDNSFNKVDEIFIERNGEISVVKKQQGVE